jgi:ubiquinone/menaquinone biosynthesis C-methylase UbiE
MFARAYDRRSRALEPMGVSEHRRSMLGGLSGRVLEVGAGNGLNFVHYPPEVAEILALEPEPYLQAKASEAASSSAARVVVLSGIAEELPLQDCSIDAAVCSLVLCSVASPARALTELRRVLRPNGQLRFYEHVAASNRGRGRMQRWVDPLWSRVAGGCHLTRDTESEMRNAGFDVVDCTSFTFQPTLSSFMTSPHITGIARR